jgi:hypothetical protein
MNLNRAAGVYENEYVNLRTIIENNSTSTALLPIVAAQGSTEPQYFSNAVDFQFHYGAPDPSISATVQSGLNFFTQGTGLWAIRVVGQNAKTSGAILATTNAGVVSLTAAPVSDMSPDALDALVPGKQAIAAFYAARGPGSHGNAISIQIESSSDSITPIASITASASASFTGALTANTEFEYYVAPLMADGERNATKVTFTSPSTGFSGANQLSWPAIPDALGYYVYGRKASGLGRIALVGMGSGSTVSYVDAGTAVPSTANLPITALSSTFQDRPFTVKVFNSNSTPVETWTCTLRPFVDSEGVQLMLEERINRFSKYIRVVSNVFALPGLPTITSQAKTAFAGGDSGAAPTSSQIVEALEPFASRQNYNVNLIINGGLADPMIQIKMDSIARRRGDCVALLDVPSGYQEWNKAIDYRNLLLCIKSDYSALFAQDQLQISNDMQVFAPMSGWVAARCAYTDNVATPGPSIAGINRGKIPVLGSRVQYSEDESDLLFRSQVNFTRTVPTHGVVLWEQQTLGCDIKWLSVRRIVNVIKSSAHMYLLRALQEMNTDTVRRELVNGMSSYLDGAVSSEAIGGYRIICDQRNNTPDTANSGVLVFTLGLIPLIPIHEIRLDIVVSHAGVAFNESIVPYLPDGTSNTTTEFSSGPAPSSYGTSNITVEYSSGTLSLPYGTSNTTNQFSSTRPF